MASSSRLKTVLRESANLKAVRGLMIGLAAAVVLVVSGFGTVIYVQLMSNVFPTGPLAIACYLGAAANFLLMIVLLVGKFAWFRPGWHELTSWLVTGVEMLIAVLNLLLSFQIGNGQSVTGLMAAWLTLAPMSPVFSMVGATLLIMTSVEMRKRHRDLELQEQKEQAERELELAFHEAEIAVKYKYLTIIQGKLEQELNAPQRHKEIAAHAALMVSQVLSDLSGMQTLSAGERAELPAPQEDASELDEDWMERANAQIEQERERARRVSADTSLAADEEERGEDEQGRARPAVRPKYPS